MRSITIRPIEQSDVYVCGKTGYLAHKTISSAHDYPSEQPSKEFGVDHVKRLVDNQTHGAF